MYWVSPNKDQRMSKIQILRTSLRTSQKSKLQFWVKSLDFFQLRSLQSSSSKRTLTMKVEPGSLCTLCSDWLTIKDSSFMISQSTSNDQTSLSQRKQSFLETSNMIQFGLSQELWEKIWILIGSRFLTVCLLSLFMRFLNKKELFQDM